MQPKAICCRRYSMAAGPRDGCVEPPHVEPVNQSAPAARLRDTLTQGPGRRGGGGSTQEPLSGAPGLEDGGSWGMNWAGGVR